MTTKEDQFNDFEGEETLGNEAQEHLEPNGLLDTDPYPYQHVNIGKESISVFQLYRKYKNNTIKLDPEFQREGNVWTPKQK